MFLTRPAGAHCAELVTGAPMAHFMHVDAAYDNFLALCEDAKRPLRPLEDSMLVKREFTGETPPAGLKQAVLVENRVKGVITDQFGTNHKLDLMWQLADRDTKGRRFILSQRCNAVWGTSKMPSSLRKAIDMIRTAKGQPPITDNDVKTGIELDDYIGENATLLLVHNAGQGGRVFANVKQVLPYTGTEKLVPEARENGDYADRQQADAQEALRAAGRASQSNEAAKMDPAEAAL